MGTWCRKESGISSSSEEKLEEKEEGEENRDEEKENSSSKKYKYFDFKNSKRKSLVGSSMTTSMRHSTINFKNLINEKKAQKHEKVEKENISERFQKSLKEQKK